MVRRTDHAACVLQWIGSETRLELSHLGLVFLGSLMPMPRPRLAPGHADLSNEGNDDFFPVSSVYAEMMHVEI